MDGDAAADHEMRMIEKAAAFGAAEEIQGEGRREKLRRMRARKEAEQQSRPKFKLNLSLFDNACGPSCDEADAWRQARLDAARAEQQKKERKELEARAKSGELNREVGSRSTRSSAPLGSGGGPKSPKRLHREQQERRALAAAAKLTRQEHFRDFGLLLASIESGAIAPLRGSYLVALSESGAKLRRRQELPPEAFFPAAELHELLATLPAEARGLLFVAISYRWLTPSEPDPTGFHLNVVADVARLYLGRGGHPQLYPRERSPLAAAFDRAGLGVENADFAAFWDWGSLHQKGEGDAPRSAEEAALYAAGRQASTVWYAHEQTVSWLQTAVPVNYRTLPDLLDAYRHGASGWTHLERVLSASIKADPQRVLDIGRTVAQSCGRAGSHVAQAERAAQAALQNAYGGRGPLVEANCLEKSCAAAERYPLMTPKELRALLLSEAKRFRPSGPFAASCEGWQSEAEVVSELYETFFDTVAQTEGRLCRRRVGWGDAEAMPLAHSLPSFTALREIDLRGNDAIGTEAWRAIGHAILLLAEHPPPYDGLESVMLDGVSSSLPIRLLRGKTPSSQPPPGGGEDTQGDGHDRGGGGGGGVGGASFASVGGALLTCASPSRSSGAGGQPKGTSALAELLHRKTQIRALERVDLDRRALGSPSAFAIGALLSGAYPNIPPNSAITELDCRHNPLITGEGARTLAEAVVSLPQIRTFSLIPISRLRDEPKSRDRGPDGPDKFKPLHELDLFDHGLGAVEAHVLAALLDVSGAPLTSLHLAYNHLGPDGGIAIANALHRNDSLTRLNLENNELGEAGGVAIAGALRVNSVLHTLDLSRNDVGDEGARAVAESCRDSRSLHVLNLSGSCRSGSRNVGPRGAQALATAIAESHSLSSLTLSNNRIGEEGARALAKAVVQPGAGGGKPSTLTSLNVRHTRPEHGLREGETGLLKRAVKGRPVFNLQAGHMVGF